MRLITVYVMVFSFFSGSLISQISGSSFTNRRYDISENEMAPNGKYVSFRKSYQSSWDSLVVLSTGSPEKIIYRTAGVKKSFFTSTGTLFIMKNKEVEVRDLKKNRSVNLKQIRQIEYLPDRHQVLMINDDKLNPELTILDEKGNPVKRYPGITEFQIDPDKSVYAVRKNADTSTLLQLEKGELSEIYSGNASMLAVLAGDSRNIVVIEQRLAEQHFSLVMINKISGAAFHLKDIFPETILEAKAVLTDHQDEVYLQLVVPGQKPPDKKADIWYGSDNSLERKFYGEEEQHYFLWKPLTANMEQLDSVKFPEIAYTGNSGHYLTFNPYELQDYSTYDVPLLLYQYDQNTDKKTEVGQTGSRVYLNKDGSLILSKAAGKWVLHNLKTAQIQKFDLPHCENVYFSLDSQDIYFEDIGGIYIYHFPTGKSSYIKTLEGFENTILTEYPVKLLPKYGIYKSCIDTGKPLIISLANKITGESALAYLKDQKLTYLVPRTENRISSVKLNAHPKKLMYVSENLNRPPQLFAGNYVTLQPIYQSNKEDDVIKKVKKEIFKYKDAEGLPVSGLLIYPLHFDRTKKYPMIVNIYEIQSKYQNVYLRDGYYGMTDGFNVRHFIEEDYFVFLPDIIFNEKGPGFSALGCVEQGLKAIAHLSNIDFKRVGLIGHSHGGYEVNFIATHSDKFAAFAAGAGNSDLVKSYFSYNNNFNSPFYWQFEDGQYRIGKPFFEDKEMYLKNSPVQYADLVNSPILLWSGKKDVNIQWEQTMEFYLALRRSKKNVIALFYPYEGHSLADEESKLDLYSRISDWFAYHLKGQNALWIK